MKNICLGKHLIGIFLLSLGGGYLFHNATPDYIFYQYFLFEVLLLLLCPDDNYTIFLSKSNTL
jgi:hypothetical protein